MKIPKWKRAVIKVGSSIVAPGGMGCRSRYMLPIARLITRAMGAGREVILVSSGAVAAGIGAVAPHRTTKSHRSIPEKQAMAAVGQSLLMTHWRRFFDCNCAQILLTHDDIRSQKRVVNIKNTVSELLRRRLLPIVNENDSVATDELGLGDNDNLAAHVAVLADADLLIILSDVDGLFEGNPHQGPQKALVAEVERIEPSIYALAEGTPNPLATGGMTTKIQAAEKANRRGIHVILANGKDDAALDALWQGICPGTFFKGTTHPINAKKHWIQHALPTRGTILVDSGAAVALKERGASLLPSGVLSVDGDFRPGDAVDVVWEHHRQRRKLATGITRYGVEELDRIKGCRSTSIGDILGFSNTDVIVHRGEMALCEAQKKGG